MNGARLQDATGFIIDWKGGAVAEPPAGLRHYKVSFYAGCLAAERNCRAELPRLAYVVAYDYDPASERGFVYLPRFAEPWFDLNCGSICHGPDVEGHWFKATEAWENFVRPIIASAVERSR